VENAVKRVNAELHSNTLLCPANVTRHKTNRLTGEWHNGLVSRRHLAVLAERQNASYVPGCD
jgi:hypothetical protein